MMMIDMLALISVAATLLTAVEAQTAVEPTTRTTIIGNSTTDTASSGIEPRNNLSCKNGQQL